MAWAGQGPFSGGRTTKCIGQEKQTDKQTHVYFHLHSNAGDHKLCYSKNGVCRWYYSERSRKARPTVNNVCELWTDMFSPNCLVILSYDSISWPYICGQIRTTGEECPWHSFSGHMKPVLYQSNLSSHHRASETVTENRDTQNRLQTKLQTLMSGLIVKLIFDLSDRGYGGKKNGFGWQSFSGWNVCSLAMWHNPLDSTSSFRLASFPLISISWSNTGACLLVCRVCEGWITVGLFYANHQKWRPKTILHTAPVPSPLCYYGNQRR